MRDLSDVTIVIVTILRNRCLKNLLNSIKQYLPGLRTLVVDQNGKRNPLDGEYENTKFIYTAFDIGISKARNKGIDNVRTEYTFLLDDDWVITNICDIEGGLNALDRYGIHFLLGCREDSGKVRKLPRGFLGKPFRTIAERYRENRVTFVPPNSYLVKIDLKNLKPIRWLTKDLVVTRGGPNIILARTKDIVEIGWPPQIKIEEHKFFSKKALRQLEAESRGRLSEALFVITGKLDAATRSLDQALPAGAR